ncbi:MAG: GAF domain-containing protein, partial [Thermoleophilaceae bacterium]
MEANDLAQRPADGGRHITCSMSSVLVRLVRAEGGDAAVAALLEKAGSPRSAAHLENVENWISIDEAVALLEAGTELTGDPHFARRVGASAVAQHRGAAVATLLRSLGAPEKVLESITVTSNKFSTVTDMEAIESSPGRAVVRAVAREGFSRHPLHCEWALGLLSTPTILFGLPPATVEHEECQARGADQCIYTVSWDAGLAAQAADPQQRVTALEAQVVAMSERLESVYATAGDIVSPDDLETVLARIVSRAAHAVRAPGYVLAVQPDPTAGLQVYNDGMEHREATEVARAVMESGGAPDSSTLVAVVASSRCDYGRLIARYPDGGHFFPQEQQLLDLYAKHAAAVLDMATALDQAEERHRHVSALFSLSRALAHAGTTREVAERLAEAIPGVVDCDRVAAWVWDDKGECLRCLATVGHSREQAEAVRSMTIAPSDTPYLARMLTEPQPLFIDNGTDDQFLHGLLVKQELAALTVVPLVARGQFLGLIAVSVAERPERLHAGAELLEKLTGVAALAATGIQNGRLIDELGHKATHDGLTGVLNRAG